LIGLRVYFQPGRYAQPHLAPRSNVRVTVLSGVYYNFGTLLMSTYRPHKCCNSSPGHDFKLLYGVELVGHTAPTVSSTSIRTFSFLLRLTLIDQSRLTGLCKHQHDDVPYLYDDSITCVYATACTQSPRPMDDLGVVTSTDRRTRLARASETTPEGDIREGIGGL
jgi:hypothetical protein